MRSKVDGGGVVAVLLILKLIARKFTIPLFGNTHWLANCNAELPLQHLKQLLSFPLILRVIT
jgi:hypothetical protein